MLTKSIITSIPSRPFKARSKPICKFYELYFREKFEEDGLKTNLLEGVEPCLVCFQEISSQYHFLPRSVGNSVVKNRKPFIPSCTYVHIVVAISLPPFFVEVGRTRINRRGASGAPCWFYVPSRALEGFRESLLRRRKN